MRKQRIFSTSTVTAHPAGRRTALAAALSATLLLAIPSHATSPSFTDVTDSAGLAFKFRLAPDAPVGRMHGGGTIADFNNDGYPDLFVVGGGGDDGLALDALFINQQDGTFANQANAWGLNGVYRGNGAAAGDYNDDGHIDLYVTSMGDLDGPPRNGQHRLYRNNGDNTFTNVANAAGVASTGPGHDGYGATFADYDLDGDLDLWVAGWHSIENGVNASVLFRNEGDGTFSEVTVAAGVQDDRVRGFAGIFADMNGDRYPELMVAADFNTSVYFANNRDGSFSKVGIWSANKVHNGMGAAVGDVNRDGRLDWFVTAIDPSYQGFQKDGNRIYMNQGEHVYLELPSSDAAPDESGVKDGGWGWGGAAVDFDHDGWVDLANTNGWAINPALDDFCLDFVTGAKFHDDPTRLFHNNGDGSFTERALEWGLEHRLQGRGLYQMDYDLDGDMDLVITANSLECAVASQALIDQAGDLHVYRNDLIAGSTPADAAWLKVYLDTTGFDHLAPQGLGAIVRVTLGNENGKPRLVNVNAGNNYLGHGEVLAHFGLASATQALQVNVEWQDGFSTRLTNVPVNQAITMRPQVPHVSGQWFSGNTVNLTARGLRPGETVYFFRGTGISEDVRCFAQFGDICTDLTDAAVTGVAVVNASGTATANVQVPGLPAGTEVFTQALIPRGANGVASLASNVVTRVVQEAP